ncbi:hypothetical protein FRC12_016926 [Ceratobasidium sp. 428]|nr:hypothetical protein FRC12_016926 [Ceratobasidium sp. 428]
MVHHLPLDYTSRLTLLRELLTHLPASIPPAEGTYYSFQDFQIGEQWVENTGSPQGAVNHALEVAFGSRAERIQSGSLPVIFEHRGVNLECVVDVLTKYLTGNSELDALLLKWLDDLIASAKPLVKTAVNMPNVAGRSGDATDEQAGRSAHKRKLDEEAAAIEEVRKRQRQETKEKEERALARTSVKVIIT